MDFIPTIHWGRRDDLRAITLIWWRYCFTICIQKRAVLNAMLDAKP